MLKIKMTCIGITSSHVIFESDFGRLTLNKTKTIFEIGKAYTLTIE